jgi:3-dehydroquinate dehydratase
MDFNEIKIYGKKTMADVLKEIHINQQDKEKELKQLISDLKPLIQTAGDSVIIVPLIKSYMDVAIKNDDNLIKMALLVQKAISSNKQNDNGDVNLSEEEKEQLLQNIKELKVV